MRNLQKSLERMLAKWQKILRLQDWDIELIVTDHNEVGHGNVGTCDPDVLERSAVIMLLRPDQLPKDLATSEYIEGIIVHELLHIHTRDCGIKPDDSEELLVRRMCKALLSCVNP